jgi:hypothetical protein
MSLKNPKRTDISTDVPYWGPDGLYRPPVEEGVEVPPSLPGHLELPPVNGEIVECLRRAQDERRRAEKFAAKLRELGVDPDTLGRSP